MKLTLENVNKILHTCWDPIGCGVPEDEYINYAKVVLSLRKQKCPLSLIKDYLIHIEVNYIGGGYTTYNQTKLTNTLDKLFELGVDKKYQI